MHNSQLQLMLNEPNEEFENFFSIAILIAQLLSNWLIMQLVYSS